jgi:Tfp pilus assembly protein PilF
MNEFQIATRLHTTGHVAEAEPLYRQLLEQRPDDAQVLHLLGLVCFQTGRPQDAVELIQKAIAKNDKIPDYHSNLGVVLDALKQQDQAGESFRRALALKPNYPEAHNNYAGFLAADGKLDEAIAEYNIAVQQKPDYPDAWDNLGSTLRKAMRFDEALAAYDKAIELQPNFAYSHYNRGTLKLMLGQMTHDAWEDYEWRWRSPTFGHPLRTFGGKPAWNGSELAGKTILFHAEQGLGDVLQFVRFASIIADHGGRVIVEAQPELITLLEEVPGVSSVVPRGSPLPDFDVHLPMLSITRVLHTTLETIPHEVPYILAPAIPYEEWRQRTRADSKAEGKKKLRVGLVWSSNPSNLLGKLKSLSLNLLAPLHAASPSVRFYSLQLGAAGTEAASSPFPIIDHTDKLTDFVQTAALVSNLDLVISVDTAVAHLTGAINQPIWLLAATPPDWRWMRDRSDSPWYPSMTIFRQESPGDWSTPIQRMADKLTEWGARAVKELKQTKESAQPTE